MPQQYVVPQFIEDEDKIMGPVTARQFVIMLVDLLFVALLYRLLRFIPFLLTGVPIIMVGGIVAFMKINGRPFHFFVLNLIQTFRRPRLRVWDKRISDDELKQYIEEKEAQEPPPAPTKKRLTGSRLDEVSLVLNTGGVYNPEEYR